ncbi:hypothetical protein [Thalassotalea montiporae]
MKPFEVSRNSKRLELTRSKKSEIIGLILSGIFFSAFLISVINTDFSSVDSISSFTSLVIENPSFLFVGLLGGIVFAQVCSCLKFILIGEKYIFDVPSEKVTRNKKSFVNFADIEAIQIRVFSGDTDTYDLTLQMLNANPKKISDFKDLSFVKEVAGNIADVTNKKVVIKE